MIGKAGNDLKLTAQCFDVAAEGADTHLRPLLTPGSGALADLECPRDLFLRELHRAANAGEDHFLAQALCLGRRLRLGLGGHARSQCRE